MMTEKEVRQAVKDAGIKLLDSGLTQGTWGNISIRLDKDHMVVTPSGLDYIALKPEDMIVVDINTLEYTSDIKPTSEKKIHAAIYRSRPDINAVIHSHPQCCSSVAATRTELPVMSEEMQQKVGGCVRVGGYGLPGTKKLTIATVDALGTDRNACLMANHGMCACATSIEEAFDVCRIVEECSVKFVEQKTLELTKGTKFNIDLLAKAYASKVK
ncbi:MAG: class II aldolase/adducin family protein [Bacillota bacterium]